MKIFKNVVLASLAISMWSCGGSASTDQSVEVADSSSNQVIETIMNRRSVRKYKDIPVEREKLNQIVECGINAPNALNQQPWEVRVVDNREFIDNLTAIYVAANPSVAEDPDFKNMFRNAPCVIFIASPVDGSGQIDCGLLGENMVIAASSMGLGTCCLGGSVAFMRNSEEAKPFIEKLGLPDTHQVLYAIAVGYAEETPEAKPRDASKVKFID